MDLKQGRGNKNYFLLFLLLIRGMAAATARSVRIINKAGQIKQAFAVESTVGCAGIGAGIVSIGADMFFVSVGIGTEIWSELAEAAPPPPPPVYWAKAGRQIINRRKVNSNVCFVIVVNLLYHRKRKKKIHINKKPSGDFLKGF